MDVGAIFNRICEAKGFSTDAELGAFLGKSPQSMSQHRKNSSFDLKTLVERFGDLDMNWILLGRRPPERSEGEIPLSDMILRILDAGYRVEKKS